MNACNDCFTLLRKKCIIFVFFETCTLKNYTAHLKKWMHIFIATLILM